MSRLLIIRVMLESQFILELIRVPYQIRPDAKMQSLKIEQAVLAFLATLFARLNVQTCPLALQSAPTQVILYSLLLLVQKMLLFFSCNSILY
jgi:hypothetical protein